MNRRDLLASVSAAAAAAVMPEVPALAAPAAPTPVVGVDHALSRDFTSFVIRSPDGRVFMDFGGGTIRINSPVRYEIDAAGYVVGVRDGGV